MSDYYYFLFFLSRVVINTRYLCCFLFATLYERRMFSAINGMKNSAVYRKWR